MRRPGLVFGAALAAVVVAGVVVVSLVDTNDAGTVSYLETEIGEVSGDRAMALCQERGPVTGRTTLAHASSTTAGEVVAVMRGVGQPAAPWDTLPGDRYVARCSYIRTGGVSSPTTFCSNGDTIDGYEPLQFLVDDYGIVTPDVTAPPTDYCGD